MDKARRIIETMDEQTAECLTRAIDQGAERARAIEAEATKAYQAAMWQAIEERHSGIACAVRKAVKHARETGQDEAQAVALFEHYRTLRVLFKAQATQPGLFDA